MKMTDWEFPPCVRRPERTGKEQQVVCTVTKKRDEDAYAPRPLNRNDRTEQGDTETKEADRNRTH